MATTWLRLPMSSRGFGTECQSMLPPNGRMHLSAAAESGARRQDMGCSSSSRLDGCRAGRRPQVMRRALGSDNAS